MTYKEIYHKYYTSPRAKAVTAAAKARYRCSEKGKAAERAYKKRYRTRENELAKIRATRAENRMKQAARQRARRAALTPRMHPTHRAVIRAIYEEARLFGLTVDHIIPLYTETVWGLHAPQNLQLLTRVANSAKARRYDG